MSSDQKKEEIEIFYWPIPWRANFLKLILADAGRSFLVAEPAKAVALYKTAPEEQPLGMMAPPMVRHGDFYINQMGAAAQYLAKVCGYDPEEVQKSAVALKVVLDCNDILDGLSRNNGHQMWDGEDEKKEDYPAWRAFMGKDGRARKWLRVLQSIGEKHGLKEDSGFLLGGDKPSYADLAVFHVIYILAHEKQFGLKEFVVSAAPKIAALYDRFLARENIKHFLDEQQQAYGDKVCGGVIEKSIRFMISQNLHKE